MIKLGEIEALENVESIKKQLRDHLENGDNWEKMDFIDGVSIIRVPATKTRSALLNIEINPLKDGKPLKKKGLFLSSKDMLLKFAEALSSNKVYQIMNILDEINPDISYKPKKKLKM